MSQWITEEQTPHLRLSAEAEEVLYSGESEFQKIEVFKSKEYGTMLALDGVFQTSEREEFIYHEMMSHVPLFLHPNPERVLIIGGGDGGVARECVRHDCVKEVTMVEIDGKVVELAKQYLPTIAKALIENNPKLTVKIGDGIGFMAEAEDYYDVSYPSGAYTNPRNPRQTRGTWGDVGFVRYYSEKFKNSSIKFQIYFKDDDSFKYIQYTKDSKKEDYE